MWNRICRWAGSSASRADLWILSAFVILVTFQPFYLTGQINLFELGLYLPGIQGVFHGQIPYRDFFHLRGPFELYMPAACMALFGKNVAVLETYFYVGNVLSLVICVWIAKELLRTRGVLYLLVPVLVARTFPRVVFAFWGGMRFALGLFAVYCLIKFFKTNKFVWFFAAGVIAAVSLFTSIEIGVGVIASAVTALGLASIFLWKDLSRTIRTLVVFGSGFLLIFVPYILYLSTQQALGPYVDATKALLVNMQNVFPQDQQVPQNVGEAVAAMFNPSSKNFRHMTPAYCYATLAVMMFLDVRRRKLEVWHWALSALAVYGVIMYVGAFRNIWASQLEMALQPEKIIYFILLERGLFFLKEKSRRGVPKWKIVFIAAAVGLTLWSVIYSFGRFQKRFPAVQILTGKNIQKIKLLSGEEVRTLQLDRISGMTAPAWQAQDLEELTRYLHQHTAADEPVFMFPEMGAQYFIVDRPWIGRFPMGTLSWLNDDWHVQWMDQLKKADPRWVVMPQHLRDDFYNIYFTVDANKRKYEEVAHYIEERYTVVSSTPTLNILKRNE